MNISEFGENKTGRLVEISSGVKGETHSFIPDLLPPQWNNEVSLYRLIVQANKELARLDGVGINLPNPQLMIEPLRMLEAQMSSELEGTITPPQQQILYNLEQDLEEQKEARSTYREVSNYKKALRLRSSGLKELPISLRLIKDLHRILMEGVRGDSSDPGEFRRLPVQIGRPARFVPPPANEVLRLLDNLEKFIHEETPQYDPLVKAFIVHYQFETIHPFLDGNGRVGRLLLAIMIEEYCNLSNQWLYLSPYFNRTRNEYLDRLLSVSTVGDWEGWLRFCLEGVIEESRRTQNRCRQLIDYSQSLRLKLGMAEKNSGRLRDIMDDLLISPVITSPLLEKKYNVSRVTASKDIQWLIEKNILIEAPERWNRAKVYFAPVIYRIIFGD